MKVRFLLTGVLLLASCSYRWGFQRPEGVRSLAVSVFENQTFRRGVELALTEQIREEVLSRSAFRLEAPERADALLRGRITDIYDSILLEGPNREVRESAVWIQVEAELVERRTGRTLSKIQIQDRAEFFTDNLQNRATATEKAVARLSEKIVLAISRPSPPLPVKDRPPGH